MVSSRRMRDLVGLLRSYPLRLRDDWVSDLKECDESELRFVEGLIPMKIMREAKKGKMPSSLLSDFSVPETILNLAADLAVHQLIQTLVSISKHQLQLGKKYIRLSTRSDVEKRAVTAKIEAALNDRHHMLDIFSSFGEAWTIDSSTYPPEAESLLRQHVCQVLQRPMKEDDDDIVGAGHVEEEMSSKRYLVLLVDRDGEAMVDPWSVGFGKTHLSGVLVFITTESAIQARDRDGDFMTDLMDLEIRTKDHVLPWHVFCHNVGIPVVYSRATILATAVNIVEECRGHLLAIVLVAKWLLRNPHDSKHWLLALHKIRHADPSHDTHKFHALNLNRVMINTFLNLIWVGISKAHRHCLLSCSRIPEITNGKFDYELMKDWHSLFLDAKETEQILTQLLVDSILLKSEGGYIRLPEETYKILQVLYSLNPLSMERSGLGLTELQNTDLWHDVIQIELADNKLSELPPSPNCQELKVLMLQGNADLTQIPSSFFVHMPLLRILDLSYTSVRELPHSFFFLEQLRELHMKGCESFMKLPPEIGNLTKLERLDLDETQITHLPTEVQKLTNMQSLTLYFYEFRGRKNMQYSSSTIVPSGVISKLKQLKHLSIGVNPDDERWHENVKVLLPEILGLEFLKSLSIYIPQLELLTPIPARLFEVDFRFIVGCHRQRILSSIPPAVDEKFKQSNCSLRFSKGEGVPPTEIKMLLRRAKALFLDRHLTIKNLSEFEMENLDQLRVCILAECKEMQTIFGSRDSNDHDKLPHLLFLSISHMKNLRSIWEGLTTPLHSFGMLQSLSLQSCPKLTTLFSFDFVGGLSLLKELIVNDCPKLRTLVSHESSNCNLYTILPKLRKLSLIHLPELTSISNGLCIGLHLKEIAVYDCPKLRCLSKNELLSQELTVIKGETKWWEALQGLTSLFGPIFSPINEEADVITQLGIFSNDNVSGASVDDPLPLPPTRVANDPSPLPPTSVTTPIINKPAPTESRFSRLKLQRNLPTWTVYSYSLLNDEYPWRKYGQKEILGMKHPRCYYRCSNKLSQGCCALKKVQRVDEGRDGPHSYETTYRGHHTCTRSNVQDSAVEIIVPDDNIHEECSI